MNKVKKLVLILTFILRCVSLPAKEHYDYITFSDSAELALTSSLELRQAGTAHTLREGAWKWGFADYLPRFNLNVSENDRLQMIGPDSFIKNYSLGIDQLIWSGGRTSMTRKLERLELNLSSSRLERMASDIGEAAISAYRNILSSRLILEIRKTALEILEEQRKILNEEVQLGLALPVDLASADINLANSKLEIYSHQLDLIEIENQFAELLGLDYLPVLAEKVDVYRSSVLPIASKAGFLAREGNPDLVEARYSIQMKQTELRYIRNSWIPAFRFNGNFGLTGQHYPLTRYNWSAGITIDFSAPWIHNRFAAQTGLESPSDRTAMVQNNLNLLPDPAAGFGRKQLRNALTFEHERYNLILERVGRTAANAVEKCILIDQRRVLAVEAARLGAERVHIEELRLQLGHITRLKLMETLMEQTQREIAVIEAAVALLEAERELERFLNLKPGELAQLAQR